MDMNGDFHALPKLIPARNWMIPQSVTIINVANPPPPSLASIPMNMLQTQTNMLHVAEKATEIRTFIFYTTAPAYFGH